MLHLPRRSTTTTPTYLPTHLATYDPPAVMVMGPRCTTHTFSYYDAVNRVSPTLCRIDTACANTGTQSATRTRPQCVASAPTVVCWRQVRVIVCLSRRAQDIPIKQSLDKQFNSVVCSSNSQYVVRSNGRILMIDAIVQQHSQT